MSDVGRFRVSKDDVVLVGFLARAKMAYTALEQAIASVDVRIEKLQQDWQPRPMNFWYTILETHIPAIRGASVSCLHLFAPVQGREVLPTPMVVLSDRWSHIVNLQHIGSKIEECGVVLTAHVYSSTTASLEAQIRTRQRLMRNLQELSKAVHEAVDGGRAQLDIVLEKQARVQEPGRPDIEALRAMIEAMIEAAEAKQQEGEAGQ